MINTKPELLAPAGDWSSLNAAIESKADSVYFGIKSINMRHMAANFDILEIEKVMTLIHKNKMKGYLTLNTIIMNNQLTLVRKILKQAKQSKVDAVILWDMSVLKIAKELGLEIHLSTQASVSNYDALKMYHDLGVKRVVLARECSLNDIKQIKQQVIKNKLDCSIETFVHGSMCVSISGRCFLSQYSYGKSANKGMCTQPCRREFKIIDTDNKCEYVIGEDYLLSPKDLCSIEFVDKLIESGIDSFKIEGRMRSPEYIKVAVDCYRKAINRYFKGALTDEYKAKLMSKLREVYNRGFSTGFYFGTPADDKSTKLEHKYEKVFVGEVTRFFKKISVAEIKLRSGELSVNDNIIFIGKATTTDIINVKELTINNEFIEKAQKGSIIGIKLPVQVKPKDKVFLWQEKQVD